MTAAGPSATGNPTDIMGMLQGLLNWASESFGDVGGLFTSILQSAVNFLSSALEFLKPVLDMFGFGEQVELAEAAVGVISGGNEVTAESLKTAFDTVARNDTAAIRHSDPLFVPAAYLQASQETPPDTITMNYDGQTDPVTLARDAELQVADEETGMAASVFVDENGHAVIFIKGMDMKEDQMVRDAATVVMGDVKGVLNPQVATAAALYADVSEKYDSVEVVGYCLGTLSTNYLAAHMGAKVTNIADLGANPELKDPDGNIVYDAAAIENLGNNVVTLHFDKDPFNHFQANARHGTIIELPYVQPEQSDIIASLGDNFGMVASGLSAVGVNIEQFGYHAMGTYARAAEKLAAQSGSTPDPEPAAQPAPHAPAPMS